LRNKNVFILVMCAMGVAINIVLGAIVQTVHIPLLFLDTIGTIFIAVLFGPWQGAAVGTITNILTPILTGNVKDIPFFIVNAVVGIIVGIIAKKYMFNLKTAIIAGLILSIVCPLIGSPIAVWLYGGITGSGNDFIFLWLNKTGLDIFTSAFIPRITGNFIDKIGSCILVLLSMKYIPEQYKNLNLKIQDSTQKI
jgi:energy-coupling factor transport system substrate-specific component